MEGKLSKMYQIIEINKNKFAIKKDNILLGTGKQSSTKIQTFTNKIKAQKWLDRYFKNGN